MGRSTSISPYSVWPVRLLAVLTLCCVLGWTAQTQAATNVTIQIQTSGSSFSPAVSCDNGAPQSFLWTFSDSTTSTNYPVVTKNFGSAASRTQYLSVVQPSAITKINLGFDGGDNGWSNIFSNRAFQNVRSVVFLTPLTGLQYWASSYNQITNTLDFSGFNSLQDIECFHCTPLKQVVVTNLPSLRRVCFEDCDLQDLDLTGCPNLEDVRGALNGFTSVTIDASTGPNIWHWCFRDNPQITQDFGPIMTNFYSLKEPWIWNANQGGALQFVSTNLTDVEVFQNHYTSADFTGQCNMVELLIHDNNLTNLTITGCTALVQFDAHQNQLPSPVLDAILAELDLNCPAVQTVDLSQNAGLLSQVGFAHYVNLTNRGVDVQVDLPATNIAYPVISIEGMTLLSENLLPTNNAIDAGEPVKVSVTLKNVGTAVATNLTLRLLAGNGVSSPTSPQHFASLAINGTTNAVFSFVAAGECGGAIIPAYQIEIGTGILDRIPRPTVLGQPIVVFSEAFDNVVPPALPLGWTQTTTGTQQPWVTDNSAGPAVPGSVMTPNGNALGTASLISPAISIPPNGACLLSFRNFYDMEADPLPYIGYDGGVLEIQIGTNAFRDILDAGGSFVMGGYNRRISTNFQSTIAGQLAWSGHLDQTNLTMVTLPASAAGQSIRLRWRAAMDIGGGGSWDGWRIDEITVTTGTCTAFNPLVIQSFTKTNEIATISWNSVPGRNYRVEYKSALDGLTWTNIPPDILATNYTASATDSPGGTQRFYRVVLLP